MKRACRPSAGFSKEPMARVVARHADHGEVHGSTVQISDVGDPSSPTLRAGYIQDPPLSLATVHSALANSQESASCNGPGRAHRFPFHRAISFTPSRSVRYIRTRSRGTIRAFLTPSLPVGQRHRMLQISSNTRGDIGIGTPVRPTTMHQPRTSHESYHPEIPYPPAAVGAYSATTGTCAHYQP
jgi:hypothetical protein